MVLLTLQSTCNEEVKNMQKIARETKMERLQRLPKELVEIFLEDMETAAESRLQILERVANK